MRHIQKRFGAVQANCDVALTVAAGTVHGIVGENGAGKSTLMSILYGFYQADSGEIEVEGKPARISGSREAISLGIGMVHQHFMLVESLCALDNVMLGAEPGWRLTPARATVRAQLAALMQRTGLNVALDSLVQDLPVGDRQRLEILKALFRGARILILDEPTAVLTPAEAEALFDVLGQMVAQGLSIIFSSHKLGEVLRVSDRIAVLRAGRLVAVANAAGTTQAQLAQWMVGPRGRMRPSSPNGSPP